MKNMVEQLFILLSDLSELIWQLNIAIACFFLLLAIYPMQWVDKWEAFYNAGTNMSQFRSLALLPYFWMGICLFFVSCFLFKAFQGYKKSHSF